MGREGQVGRQGGQQQAQQAQGEGQGLRVRCERLAAVRGGSHGAAVEAAEREGFRLGPPPDRAQGAHEGGHEVDEGIWSL